MNERRKDSRILIRRLVDVSWEQGHGVAWGRDISLGGMYIQASRQPTHGADVHLRIRFRRSGTISVPARVCRTDDKGFAVQFLAVGQPEAEAIRKVLGSA
ncbi:PilZ domain-containing protein [Myxococcota bacterium]